MKEPKAIKQVIVVRKDLKLRRGKEIAQGAHAAMAWEAWTFFWGYPAFQLTFLPLVGRIFGWW